MLFNIIKSSILGIVEGFTEFLPISSTGHLIIANQWLTFEKNFTFVFDIVIQLGAILAVIVYFWPKLWPFGNNQEKNQATWKIWQKIIVAVIPALVLGKLFGNFIEEKLFNWQTVVIALITGGIILLAIERKDKNPAINSISDLSFKTAFFIGIIQCLAMIPGTSRAAATIIGAMLLGSSRKVAVEFSFFLAIPTMIAASGYSLMKYGLAITSQEAVILAVGFFVSFAAALFAIRFLMKYIQNHNFNLFGWYRIILAAIIFILFFLK